MKLAKLTQALTAFSFALGLSFVVAGCGDTPAPTTPGTPAPAGAAANSDPLTKIEKEGKAAPKEEAKPKPDAPKDDLKKVEPAKEAPKVEAPKVEAPKEAPKVEAPKVEAPKEAPKVEAPKTAPELTAPKDAAKEAPKSK